MTFSHYPSGESCGRAWLTEMIAIETEGQIVPEVVQTNFSRVVSRDSIRGEAVMESEAVPA